MADPATITLVTAWAQVFSGPVGGVIAGGYIAGTITGWALASRTILKTALARIEEQKVEFAKLMSEQKEDFLERLDAERHDCDKRLDTVERDRMRDHARIAQLEGILLIDSLGNKRQVAQVRESTKSVVPPEMRDRIVELDRHEDGTAIIGSNE